MNIIITGATKGIGRAVAERFAAAGFELIVCSRKETELSEFKKYLEEKYSIQCHTQQCDVGEAESLQAFIKFIQTNFKRVDVLVNNAAMFRLTTIVKEEEGLLEDLMNVNVVSIYKLTRGVLSLMKESPKPHIFNMCSVSAISSGGNGGSYSISKHALLGLTRNLREELKPAGIRVTAVMPGSTYTNSWKGVSMPEEKFIPAADVAEMIYASYSLSAKSVVEEIIIRPVKGDIKEEDFG